MDSLKNSSKMKKLEEITKKDLFNAPEGYFEAFPMRMQQKIESVKALKSPVFYSRPVFKYAFAFVLIISIAVVLSRFADNGTVNGDAWLAEIPSNDLVAYLEQSDFIFDDFINEENADLWSSLLLNDEFDTLEDVDEELLEEYLEELDYDFQLN